MTVTGTKPHPIFLAGRWVDSPGRPRSSTTRPTRPARRLDVPRHRRSSTRRPSTAAVAAFEVTRRLPAYERGAILRNDQRRHQGAPRGARPAAWPREAGKPIRDALVEVDRAVADLPPRRRGGRADGRRGDPARPDARRRAGRHRASPGASRSARSPAISPFNFPLNLAAHKLAPAIASGCPIVLKPPSKDPLTMLTVAEIVEEAGAARRARSASCR